MTTGIIGALPQETEILLSQMQACQSHVIGPCTFYQGQLNGQDVVLLQSGVGKTAAAMAATLLIDQYRPARILNTGSAGGFAHYCEVGDIVISTQVRHHDVDVTAFGLEMGQGYGFPAAFESDPKLVELALEAAKQQNCQAFTGLICTGDSFMDCPTRVDKARNDFPEMLAAEMEAAAIAQVCAQFSVPFVVVRALSDIAGKASHQSFTASLATAVKHSSQLVMDTIKLLN
ncbi:5'-methylthioadenosine/S-adenosylhomocysteine nucleosidase [Gayadomonas joobiniege]|uniref:5'-methylthioadenosine/S-adenosylhomocysteine nucleosidase n=1 Tax=Gayadomonas joobiniege TaxID=1234606 RepID=UPI00037D985F|nr:5'-methylthioadenosine/S-adenosylhomocysteine nucleosidase [Gayadomonas joobiniege]